MEPLNTIAGRALDDQEEPPSKEFKIPEIQDDVIDKLGKKESDILDNIQNLYARQDMLDWKFRSGDYKFWRAKDRSEWKSKELGELKQSLYEHEKPTIQIVKLHKGIHHGCTTDLVKERRMFKQIKQAREEAIQVQMRPPPEVWTWWDENLDTKEAVKRRIKVITNEIEELTIRRMKYWEHGRLDFKKAAIEKKIEILKTKLENIRLLKAEASKTTT